MACHLFAQCSWYDLKNYVPDEQWTLLTDPFNFCLVFSDPSEQSIEHHKTH